jgi:hypothetical protein
MLIKCLFLVLGSSLLTANFANGQLSVGAAAGVSDNFLNSNIANQPYTLNRPKVGYSLGAKIENWLPGKFGLEADPEIIQKNHSMERTDSFYGIVENYRNTYLQVPVGVNWRFGKKKVFGFVGLGGYLGYWLAGRIKGRVPDILNANDSIYPNGQGSESIRLVSYDEKYVFDPKRDNRLEIGWFIGAGVNYRYRRKWIIFTETRYYQSLSDQQKSYMINQVPRYNQTYSLIAGCKFLLGHYGLKSHN